MSTLVISGEKNLLLQFCLQHATGEAPGAPLPVTPPKPAWDLVDKSIMVLPYWDELQLSYSDAPAIFSAVFRCEFPSHWFLLQFFSSAVF